MIKAVAAELPFPQPKQGKVSTQIINNKKKCRKIAIKEKRHDTTAKGKIKASTFGQQRVVMTNDLMK